LFYSLVIDMTDTPPAPVGAQIIARIVQALIPPHPDGHPLEECFPNVGALDASGTGIVPIPSGTTVTPGMTYDGKAFGPPPPPPKPVSRPRSATVSALLDALSTAQRATITPDHMSRLVARAATGPVVISDPKVGRAATDMSMTADAWFTLAGA